MWRAPVLYEKDLYEKEILANVFVYGLSIKSKYEIRMFDL